MRYLYLWWSLHSDIGLLSIEPRTAGEDEDSLSIITLCIYSLFKFCQDEAVLWPSQESRPRPSFSSLCFWRSLLVVGLVFLEMSRLVTGSHSPQSPIPRVSSNSPINNQNKLTVYKQHNHNATCNDGLWLVMTVKVKMTSILTSDWPSR